MTTVYIYLLRCPISGEVRYVGKTQNILARKRQHLYEARKKISRSHKVNWLRSLLAKGLHPIMEIDLVVSDPNSWKQAEVDRVAYYKKLGCDLTNSTEGGDEPSVLSEEGRAELSRRASETFGSEEARKRQSEMMKANCQDAEWLARRTAKCKEVRANPEYKARMSARSKMHWQRPGYRENISRKRRELGKDPNFRRKLSISASRRMADPLARAASAMHAKKAWSDPAKRAARIAKIRASVRPAIRRAGSPQMSLF